MKFVKAKLAWIDWTDVFGVIFALPTMQLSHRVLSYHINELKRNIRKDYANYLLREGPKILTKLPRFRQLEPIEKEKTVRTSLLPD